MIDGNSGTARGVRYCDRTSRVHTEALGATVVLCASAFESVRILLNSACPEHPEGIGASSGVLGRYVSDHLLYRTAGTTSSQFCDQARAAEASGLLDRSDPYGRAAPSVYIPDCVGKSGDERRFLGGYGILCAATEKRWTMLAFGSTVPRFDNRVTLHPRRKDAWGIPIAHIDVRHGDNERQMMAHIDETMQRIIRQVGFTVREWNHGTTHGPRALLAIGVCP